MADLSDLLEYSFPSIPMMVAALVAMLALVAAIWFLFPHVKGWIYTRWLDCSIKREIMKLHRKNTGR